MQPWSVKSLDDHAFISKVIRWIYFAPGGVFDKEISTPEWLGLPIRRPNRRRTVQQGYAARLCSRTMQPRMKKACGTLVNSPKWKKTRYLGTSFTKHIRAPRAIFSGLIALAVTNLDA